MAVTDFFIKSVENSTPLCSFQVRKAGAVSGFRCGGSALQGYISNWTFKRRIAYNRRPNFGQRYFRNSGSGIVYDIYVKHVFFILFPWRYVKYVLLYNCKEDNIHEIQRSRPDAKGWWVVCVRHKRFTLPVQTPGETRESKCSESSRRHPKKCC